MPKITEYGEPNQAEAPREMFTSRQQGEGGSWAEDISRFGGQLAGLADQQNKRNVQEEVSNAQVDVATTRAEYQMKLDQQIRSGSVDIAGLQNEYKEHVDSLGEKYQTPQAKSLYEREMKLSGIMINRNAIGAQATLKGKQAEDNWRTTVSTDSNTIYNHPTDFKAIYLSNAAAIDAQVASGVINADQGRDLKYKTGVEFSMASVKGFSKNSPGAARKALATGMYNEWLDGEKHGALDEHIKRQEEMMAAKHERLMALKETNPWKFLAAVGETGGVKPLDLQGDSGQSFLNRANWVDAMEKKHGIKVDFMSPIETLHIQKQLEDANPSDAAMLANDMADKVQPKYLAKFAGQIYAKEPALGISTMLAGDDPVAAKDILAGASLMRKRKGDDGRAVEQLKQNEVNAHFDKHVGQAIEDANFRLDVKSAAEAMTVKTMFDNGADFTADFEKEYKKSVDKIIGPPANINGRKTLTFRGSNGKFLDEDALGDLVHGLKDSEVEKIHGDLPRTLSGESINLEKSRGRLQFKAVGDGKYWVFRDGMPAMDKSGIKPFKLNLKLLNAIKESSPEGVDRDKPLRKSNAMIDEIY